MKNDQSEGQGDSESIRNTAQGLLDATSHVADQTLTEAKNRLAQALEWSKPLEEVVRKNPLPSVVVALGIGALIGRLLAGRERSCN